MLGGGMQALILRVLVVDDSEIVRRGICQILQSQADIEVVCEAADGADAVRKVREHRPHVVLLDITMPVMNGFDAARRIKYEFPSTLILVVSQFDSAPFAREAIAAGASAYVMKSNASTELIPALRKLHSQYAAKAMHDPTILEGRQMDKALRAKLDEARARLNSQQAGINADRRDEDRATREWARGKQRPANAERDQFRNSLTDEDRNQIEERIQQLLDDNPALSPANAATLHSKVEPPSVSVEVFDEYYFLRDIIA
jgi:YesN/AraC family two-component response regulator